MHRRRGACFQLMLLVGLAASSQAQQIDLSVLSNERVATALASGDLKALEAQVRAACDTYFVEARNSQMEVPKRVTAADNAVLCIEKSRALLTALAPDADVRARVRDLMQPWIDDARATQQRAESEADFMGLNWGLGFGFSVGSDDAVDDAEIVEGLVRVKSEKREQPRALLEFHKFLWCNNHGTNGTRGCGPFVAVAATQDKVLSGVGMGFMYGLKAQASDSDGFSIGIGAILDGGVKDLADGFKPNEAPPSGETQVRYEEKARWSALLFVTRTF